MILAMRRKLLVCAIVSGLAASYVSVNGQKAIPAAHHSIDTDAQAAPGFRLHRACDRFR